MPQDNESGWVEPDIVINGRALTFSECMAVRVAVSNFRLQLSSPSLRDGLGEGLADGYDQNLLAVERAMLARKN